MEIKNLLYVEKYRPSSLEDLIFTDKNKLEDYLKSPLTIPSFIFYSNKPGTGKTSCAKIIIEILNTDFIMINASDERGIDTIREKIKLFARGMSFNPKSKRCVFLDEACSLTKQAMESMKALMEEYSDNCFFIFSCNNLSHIIEPIRSRCVSFNFSKPDKKEIQKRLINISELEEVELSEIELQKTIDIFYPDIRSMIMSIQDKKMGGGLEGKLKVFNEALLKLKAKDIEYFRQKIFSQELDIFGFNVFLFDYFFTNHKILGLEKTSKILFLLADTERSMNIGNNIEIIFASNLLEIFKLL
jgi:replication factor C small subunit